MSVEEQKMLGRFLKLSLPRFFGSPCEDTYKFLITCEDRLLNLGLVETCDVDYTTF